MSALSPSLTVPAPLIERLKAAQSLVVLTGAGISAESGIPTFRDSHSGLWAQFNPAQLATPESFHENPQRVMDWYRWRRTLVEKAQPNAGHLALATVEQLVPHFTLITQNVDGLHRAAGSRNVIELHGSLTRLRCSQADHGSYAWSDDSLPKCPACGALLRPDVVWFGEAILPDALDAALEASRACDVFLSVGTSGAVEPAASLPYEALRHKATVVEINPTPTPLTVYTPFFFPHPAGPALSEILKKLIEA